MTVTLNGGISASAIHLVVNAPVTDPAPYYQMGSEVLRVESYYENEGDGALKLVPNYTRWTVERGQVGTAKAIHADGVTLTPLYPQVGNPAIDTSGGAGALSLDNTIDPPSDITSLVAAGATVVGSEATLRGKDFYAQDTDPGEVGAGSVWKDTASSNNFWERNATNDGWDARFAPTVVAVVDAEANVGILAVASGFGNAYASPGATSAEGNAVAGPTAVTAGGLADARPTALSVDGDAYADSTATASGAGDASAGGIATTADGVAAATEIATTTAGLALAGSLAVRGAVSAGMSAEVDGTSGRMAFNGTTPIAIPVIPATPDAQDIADVLVALGLATQTP